MNKTKVLFSELTLFAIIQFLGIFVASKFLMRRPEVLAAPEISLTFFIAVFLLSIVFIFIAMRLFKNKHGFKLLFVFLIVIGSRTVFSAFMSEFYASIIALILVALWVAIPYVFMHNIALIFAISGISTELGFSLSLSTILFLFGVLSIYDVIAVYKTKHMVKMFTGLMDRGLLLALIVPITKSWLSKVSEVKPKAGFLLLGTGDIAFPLILAVSVLKISLYSSIFVAVGSIIGAALVFYLLINQQSRRAIPALPPIALCSIAGFIISLII